MPGDGLTLTNPLAAEESVLRTSLRPGLLKALQYNASHRARGVWLFEIGHVYRREPGLDAALPAEEERVAVALSGVDALGAAGWLAAMAAAFGLDYRLEPAALDGLHPTRSARIVAGGREVGLVGEIDPAVGATHFLDERIGYVDLAAAPLFEMARGATYRPVSRFPSSDIDLAFEVDESCAAGDVAAALRDGAGAQLADVWLFDVYRGAGLRPGHRSLAYTLRFQAPDHTLTDDEVAGLRRAAIEAVESRLTAKLRGQ